MARKPAAAVPRHAVRMGLHRAGLLGWVMMTHFSAATAARPFARPALPMLPWCNSSHLQAGNVVDGFDYGELGVDPTLDPELVGWAGLGWAGLALVHRTCSWIKRSP